MLGWATWQGGHAGLWGTVNEKLDKVGVCVIGGIINKKVWDPMHSSHPCELRVLIQNIGNMVVTQKS